MSIQFIDIEAAAHILDEHPATVRRKAKSGLYKSTTIMGTGGNKGVNYLIEFSSLPQEAQLKHLYATSDEKGDMPLSDKEFAEELQEYKERSTSGAIDRLFIKYNAVQEVLQFSRRNVDHGALVPIKKDIAKSYGVSLRAMEYWVRDYLEYGIHGLMRKQTAKKGRHYVICTRAEHLLKKFFLDTRQRSMTVCYDQLTKEAERLGVDACKDCAFNPETAEYRRLIDDDYYINECRIAEREGMQIPKTSRTARAILAQVPGEVSMYARNGLKNWEAQYMLKARREKPKLANECWFGDHYQFDAFVIDRDGNVAKPWLTAWYDIATGCVVGWYLSIQPNSSTIAEALAYGIQDKTDFPFWGVPKYVYTDNGKDYRSNVFEGGNVVEKRIENAMEYNIETEGLLIQLHIKNVHAKAYHGWAKPIERFFGTFSDRYVRELPGWCGRNPDERPENFAKTLKKLVENNQLMTLDNLRDWFVEVLHEYHNTPHAGYNGEKPIDLYNRLEKARHDKPGWAVLGLAKMEAEYRKVTTQGIRFDNELYFHPELRHYVNEQVKIKFNRGRKDVLIVMKDGKYICAAPIKETLKMVGEDNERIAEHIALQKTQQREVKAEIANLRGDWTEPKPKRSSANGVTGNVKPGDSGNLTILEYEKAMKDYKKESEKVAAPEQTPDTTRNRFIQLGKEVLNRRTTG